MNKIEYFFCLLYLMGHKDSKRVLLNTLALLSVSKDAKSNLLPYWYLANTKKIDPIAFLFLNKNSDQEAWKNWIVLNAAGGGSFKSSDILLLQLLHSKEEFKPPKAPVQSGGEW